MINITIKIIAPLKNPFGTSDFRFEIAENSSINDLLVALGYNETNRQFIMPVVNNTLRRFDYVLQENDEIVLSVPMGGG